MESEPVDVAARRALESDEDGAGLGGGDVHGVAPLPAVGPVGVALVGLEGDAVDDVPVAEADFRDVLALFELEAFRLASQPAVGSAVGEDRRPAAGAAPVLDGDAVHGPAVVDGDLGDAGAAGAVVEGVPAVPAPRVGRGEELPLLRGEEERE